jgi:hypothetical protein
MRVEFELPDSIRKHSEKVGGRKARRILREIQPRTNVTRELIRLVLEMDDHGRGHEHAWPGHLTDKDLPGISDWLMDAENSRPGCLITWYEGDAINASFDEEKQHMGEKGPCQPNAALPVRLDQSQGKLDEQVRRTFDYAAAMLRSLASAAKIVEIVRGSTMNISVNIGSSQDFRLSRASPELLPRIGHALETFEDAADGHPVRAKCAFAAAGGNESADLY